MHVKIFLPTLRDKALGRVEERVHLGVLLFLLRRTAFGRRLSVSWIIDLLLHLLELFEDILVVK